MPSLGLFGDVVWRSEGREHRLPSGRPTSLAVLLAEHQPAPICADRIIDCLWDEPLRSGANAVQRHVSALRRSLRDAGLPGEAIETLPAGYRLHRAVRTDLGALDDVLDGPDAAIPTPGESGDGVRWWLEPVPDVPWGPHALFRLALTRRVGEVARRWAARARSEGPVDRVVEVLGAMTALHPEDDSLWAVYADALVATGDSQLVTAAHRRVAAMVEANEFSAPAEATSFAERRLPSPEARLVPPDGLAGLQACVARWGVDDADGAFEELDGVGPRLAPDVARRVARCLVWTGAQDGYAAMLWRHFVPLANFARHRAESALLSLDAYSLEQMHDGVEVADREIQASTTVDELVRALQVRFLVGLGHPIDSRQHETVERLASMGDGVAQAESRRFRAILHVKQGRLDDAFRQLDAYEAVAGRASPTFRGDVASLARAVLAPARERPVHGVATDTSVVPLLLNQMALDASDLWHRLVRGHAPQDPSVVRLYHGVRAVAPPRLGQAIEAVRRVRLSGLSDAEAEIDALRTGAPAGTRDVQAASAALAEIALETRSDELARDAFELLEPWADEHLGVWPLQLVIGPAGRHLQELGARAG